MVIRKKDGTVIAGKALNAKTFCQRMTGLVSRRFSTELDGMFFEKCPAVHSFFMRYNFDLIFIDENGVVLKLYENVRPYRICSVKAAQAAALECPAQTIFNAGLKVGDQLQTGCEIL